MGEACSVRDGGERSGICTNRGGGDSGELLTWSSLRAWAIVTGTGYDRPGNRRGV